MHSLATQHVVYRNLTVVARCHIIIIIIIIMLYWSHTTNVHEKRIQEYWPKVSRCVFNRLTRSLE